MSDHSSKEIKMRVDLPDFKISAPVAFTPDGALLFDDGVVVVDVVSQLPRSRPYPLRDYSKISEIVVHHKAGGYLKGLDGAIATARFCQTPPVYSTETGKRVGGGRGWPGHPYHIDVPFVVPIHEHRLVAMLTSPLREGSWHAGSHNTASIGIAFQGCFYSKYTLDGGHPSPAQIDILGRLHRLLNRVLRVNLRLLGHAEAGKPSCPGDDLMAEIRRIRGDTDPGPSLPSLKTWKERQEALILLGYGLIVGKADGIYGDKTKAAVEAFRSDAGLSAVMYRASWDDETAQVMTNWIVEPK